MTPKPEPPDLHHVCKQVAAYMGDSWRFSPDHEDRHHGAITNGVLKIGVRYDSHKHRFDLSCWTWPTYLTLERGDVRTNTVWPRDLPDSPTQPSATVSCTRGWHGLYKDLTSKLLPAYEAIYNQCNAVACVRQTHENESRARWEAVCRLIHKDSKHTQWYNSIGPLSIENRGGSLHVDGYVTLDQVRGLVEFFKTTAKE